MLVKVLLLILTPLFWRGEGGALAQICFQKTYGTSSYEEGNCVRQTFDGGYILSGYTESLSSMSDFFVIKTNSNGDTIWAKTYG